MGGINKPKLVQCSDSTGTCQRQLVKSGSDDMRQDAVMQQFFGLVNHFLQASAPTRKRQLRITTYKVYCIEYMCQHVILLSAASHAN